MAINQLEICFFLLFSCNQLGGCEEKWPCSPIYNLLIHWATKLDNVLYLHFSGFRSDGG